MVPLVIKLSKALLFNKENFKQNRKRSKSWFFKGQDVLQLLHFLEAINRFWKMRIVSLKTLGNSVY